MATPDDPPPQPPPPPVPSRRNHVRVFARVRPCDADEEVGTEVDAAQRTLTVELKPRGGGLFDPKEGVGERTIERRVFSVARVLGSAASQEEVYQTVAAGAVETVLRGVNATARAPQR